MLTQLQVGYLTAINFLKNLLPVNNIKSSKTFDLKQWPRTICFFPDLNNLHFQKQLHCLEFSKDVSRNGTDNLKLLKNSFYITAIIIEIDYLPAFLIINCSTSLFTPLSTEKSVELNTSESSPVTLKSVLFE